jgi:K+-sensing histidine kinase KdpD
VSRPSRSVGVGLLVGLIGVAVVTASLLPFRTHTSRAIPVLVFEVPVVAAAIVGRRVAAIVTALIAAFMFSFSFVPPYDRVSIAAPEDAFALGVFVLVAAVVGTLVSNEVERREAAEERTEEIRRLSQRNEELAVEAALMERLDEQRSALLRSVSHDLRTPLATIRAVTSDLREGTVYEPETRDRLLDLVGDEAERLNRLVENLLSLSRIEAGAFQPDRQAVALDEIVADRVHKLARLFVGNSVEVDLEPALPLVMADYSQLDQVLSNLLENAARHAPRGSIVHVNATPVDQMMEVVVSDEGEGVPPEAVDHIFEAFRTAGTPSSTGVGLAICKAIVEAHGGSIRVPRRPYRPLRSSRGGPSTCLDPLPAWIT